MTHRPPRLYAQLYDAFKVELLYRHDQGQVTSHAALPSSTPHALTAILRRCQNLPPALAARFRT